MFCYKCGTEIPEGAGFCHKCGSKVVVEDVVQKSLGLSCTNDADAQQSSENTPAGPTNVQPHDIQECVSEKKKPGKHRKYLIILGAIIILVIIIAVNWEGKVDYVATVKEHAPFAVSQGLPYTYEEVLTRYMDSLEWEVREDGKIHYVDISATPKGTDNKFVLTIKVSADPDDPDHVLISPVSAMVDDEQVSEEEAIRILYELFCMYDAGYEVTGEADFLLNDEAYYSEYEEAARPLVLDWFERHPLRDNIRIQFMNELTDTGEGRGNYLVYKLYAITGEEYGIFLVNPDIGDIIMDSLINNSGKWQSIQVSMNQWYLEYYWGGTYSELYMDDIYNVYDGTGATILEYHADDDSYVICDFDGIGFVEYDDGTASSDISIADFAGEYDYDGSFEAGGVDVNFEYLLEIGEWDGYCFSISESWRGNTLLYDEWARPKSLIVNTLTFEVSDMDGVGYETHTLTYIPAQNSPLRQDVFYLDGDDTMPFVRN